MLIALYVGRHAGDSVLTRLGWAATRLVQRGEYKQVTHCEAILDSAGGLVDIGSASVRDGNCVRVKQGVRLAAGNWRIVDVPQWDTARAQAWFQQHAGEPYDWRGAAATVFPGHHRDGSWFCNESVGASVGLRSPHSFGPAQFAAICFSLGHEVTSEFFAQQALA